MTKKMVYEDNCPWNEAIKCKHAIVLKVLKRAFARMSREKLIEEFSLTDCECCVFREGTKKDGLEQK